MQENIRSTFANNSLVCITDRQGNVLQADASFCKLLKLKQAQVHQRPYGSLTSADWKILAALLPQLEEKPGTALKTLLTWKMADGAELGFEVTAHILNATLQKNTVQVMLQHRLLNGNDSAPDQPDLENMLAGLVMQTTGAGTLVFNPLENLFEIDSAAAMLLGQGTAAARCTIEQFCKRTDSHGKAALDKAFKELVKGGQTNTAEFQVNLPDGHKRSLKMALSAKHTLQGRLHYIAGVIVPVQKSERREDALKLAEAKFRNLVGAFRNVGVQGYAADGSIVYWNNGSEALYGYTAAEMIGKKIYDIMPDEEGRQMLKKHIDHMLNEGVSEETAEFELLARDGTKVHVLASHLMFSENGQPPEFYCVDIDITEMKKVQDALCESESIFRTLSEQATLAIAIFQDNEVRYFNEKFCELSGLDPEQALNWKLADIAKQIHPEDRDFVLQQSFKKQQGEQHGVVANYSFRVYRKPGDLRWLEIYSKSLAFRGRSAVFATYVDITERKKNEEHLKVQNSRLMEIARIHSHNLRGPLASIMGLVQILDTRNPANPQNVQVIESVKACAEKLDEIVHNVVERTQQIDEQF